MKMVHCHLFLLATIAIFHISAHGAMPPRTALADMAAPLPSAATDFLEAHNKARAEVGVQPLNWSQQLENATSRLVRYQRNNLRCQFANLTAGKYGANQLHASGGAAVTPRMAVEEWVKQKEFYNHADNSCLPNHRCGVYTQVVWRKSVALGCAQATCVKEQSSLTICFYDPPGNYAGESPY
ncbi:hypothetical protein RIF29_33577 [Crotalaria pallida]|uniref:SCP domain-containing protein n=1 Tax=Crotalaria pallida TaxID=3830 RepID=A0AAN9HQS5_CROPI